MLEGRAARRRPILILRIVEAELYALLPALGRQFFQSIALERRRLDDVEGIGPGIEHGESIMMLGCDHDVFHARRLRQADDLPALNCVGLNFAASAL